MSRPPKLTTSPLKVVVLVLENDQGEVLLTQRKKHQHLAEYWEFPGGKIEPGESPNEALQRECLEELSHQIMSAKEILRINHNYPTFSIELMVFHEITNKPQVAAAENQNMRWVKKSKIKNFKLPEANTSILKYLQNH